jgi:hypothetical protein
MAEVAPFLRLGAFMPDSNSSKLIVLEAELARPGMSGREWEVTIIGPKTPSDIIKVDGREYIRSMNGRFYSVKALAESAAGWERLKVYDNHLTPAEFRERGRMRSGKKEWLGNIVNVTWDAAGRKLRGIFKVVDSDLSSKLMNALEAGILDTVGLSIDAGIGREGSVVHEGRSIPVIESFSKFLSVDFVTEPAAGGGFGRVLAAQQVEKENMDDETKQNGYITKDELPALISSAVEEALAKRTEEEIDVETLDDEEVVEALATVKKSKLDKQVTEAQKVLNTVKEQSEKARHEAALARTELLVTQKLGKSLLPERFAETVRAQFAGRVVEAETIDNAIDLAREAFASLDPTGRVKTGGISDVQVGVEQDERFQLAVMQKIMGRQAFREIEQNADPSVKERLLESKAHKSWVNAGRPELPNYSQLSHLLYEYYGGDLLLDTRLIESVTTSTLSTAVKNTVNIMAANSYSQRELWFERIVRTLEVDTIDDATLARVYGVDTLDVVPEGAAYTELNLADEEETASFVKRGNYIGVTLETLLKDKIQVIQRIPQVLADTWYNTQSDLVSNVFTVNTAAGPVLADSGALFNATAATTPGGHANLLTTALSHTAYGAVRTAMQKQRDQPLGVGRKVLIRPRYLLVPVDLETSAREIAMSDLVPGADMDSAGQGAQTKNLYMGEFEVITVPTWTDATDWAAVADPARYPAIWLIYPRGQRTPQIFSADNETGGSMFTNDELRFKVRLMTYRYSATYDCAPVSDFRPLHKSNVGG